MIENKAARYVEGVLSGEIPAPLYVKKQLLIIEPIFRGKDTKYIVSEKKLKKLYKILKLMNMPKGANAGKSIYDSLVGFQWLFIIAALCIVHRDDEEKRRYENIILEIARKNGKTFLIAVIFIVLMLTEPPLSKFYSVAPDGALSRELKQAVEEIIESSPALCGTYKGRLKFKILRDYVKFNITKNTYIPLNYSRNRMDAREPSAFLVDETGALPSPYAIEAMRSGQLHIKNRLGFVVSTKYPSIFNPFEEEIADAKKKLDGLSDGEKTFALLYEPDEPTAWDHDDNVIFHANPLAVEIKSVLEKLKEDREKAINIPSRRENFLTKHLNILYQGIGTETYIAVEDVQQCRTNDINWTGRRLYIGLDLSMTTDNCAVAIAAYDEYNNMILADVKAFVPEDKVDEKCRIERIDYHEFIRAMKCVACGDRVVDYAVIEKFILGIEEEYGGEVVGIGYDRFNALSTAQKLEEAGYTTIIIKQHSSVLHRPTKWLEELVLSKHFAYEENKLLEINFENARCTYDTNLNRYVNKKRSIGKVDMVIALINALYLVQEKEILEEVQTWGGIEI